MSEYVTLLGAEDVLRAARIISEAAGTMVSAAEHGEVTAQQSYIVLDSFLERFEALVERMEAIASAPLFCSYKSGDLLCTLPFPCVGRLHRTEAGVEFEGLEVRVHRCPSCGAPAGTGLEIYCSMACLTKGGSR